MQQLEGTQSILMSSADRVAHIDGQLMQSTNGNTRASSEYKCPKVIKPSNPFTNVCWVSVLTGTFSPRRHKFWLHRQFLLPNSETKK